MGTKMIKTYADLGIRAGDILKSRKEECGFYQTICKFDVDSKESGPIKIVTRESNDVGNAVTEYITVESVEEFVNSFELIRSWK